jgi:cystathionine gamma-lyase
MSPFYQSPLLLGADLVLHSITKYINGHSDVLMGALTLAAPHRFASKPAGSDLESRLRFLQNAIGAVPSAYDAWLAQRGAKTLALRMKTHGTNALRLARWLNTKGKALGLVKEVVYPGLRSTAGGPGRYEIVRDKLMSPHARKWVASRAWEGAQDYEGEDPDDEGVPFGGMLSFRIADPPIPPIVPSSVLPSSSLDDATPALLSPTPRPPPIVPARSSTTGTGTGTAERFLTSTSLFTLAESLGGIESLAEVPARMTHASLPPQARLDLGISDDLIRLSVGVEDVDDLLADVERALRWAVKGERWSPPKVEVEV